MPIDVKVNAEVTYLDCNNTPSSILLGDDGDLYISKHLEQDLSPFSFSCGYRIPEPRATEIFRLKEENSLTMYEDGTTEGTGIYEVCMENGT